MWAPVPCGLPSPYIAPAQSGAGPVAFRLLPAQQQVLRQAPCVADGPPASRRLRGYRPGAAVRSIASPQVAPNGRALPLERGQARAVLRKLPEVVGADRQHQVQQARLLDRRVGDADDVRSICTVTSPSSTGGQHERVDRARPEHREPGRADGPILFLADNAHDPALRPHRRDEHVAGPNDLARPARRLPARNRSDCTAQVTPSTSAISTYSNVSRSHRRGSARSVTRSATWRSVSPVPARVQRRLHLGGQAGVVARVPARCRPGIMHPPAARSAGRLEGQPR